jgi:hypothetical protein
MWLDLLRSAVAATSTQAVAEALTETAAQLRHSCKVSRTAVSLVLNGKYPAKTDRIELLVLTRYAKVHCPHLQQDIDFATCRQHHTREAPTSSPFAMRHWRACQDCHNRRPSK